MGVITRPNSFVANTTIEPTQVNDDLNTIYSEFNGSISNANIDSSAAIAATKISGTAAVLSGNTFTGKNTFLNTVQTVTDATDAATVTFDLSLGNIHTVTLGGNRTLAISNETAGQVFVIKLIQDGTGSRTVTWFDTISWAYGVAPTLTTTAAGIDVFGFICTAADTYDGFIIGQALAEV
jgi:hypothetical protein